MKPSLTLTPNLIRLPDDLDAVTHIDHASETPPAEAGLAGADIDKIWRAAVNLYRSRTHPGLSLAIRYRGRRVLDRAIGHARGNGPGEAGDAEAMPMRSDTPVCLFSASKAITAMLVHKVAEEGSIKLHDPVAEYIPEFAVKGKQYITVGHILQHKGGIPTIQRKDVDPSILWDWDAVLDLLCRATPRRDAGMAQAYHAITGGFILGEVMRRATGQDLSEIIRTRLQEPLGSRYLGFGLKPEEQAQAAHNYFTGWPEPFPVNLLVKNVLGGSFAEVCEISNTPEFMSAPVPAGNIYATAGEACDFFQCLLNGGEFAGRRLFKRATVARAISEASPRQFDRTLLVPLRASEGFMLGDSPFGMYGPRTREAFGHLGFINIFCWADPSRDISVTLLTNGKPFIAPHFGPLVKLLNTINKVFTKA